MAATTITLATADGDVIQELADGSEAGQDVSLTRDPDLTGEFVQHDGATGADGAVFSPGYDNWQRPVPRPRRRKPRF